MIYTDNIYIPDVSNAHLASRSRSSQLPQWMEVVGWLMGEKTTAEPWSFPKLVGFFSKVSFLNQGQTCFRMLELHTMFAAFGWNLQPAFFRNSQPHTERTSSVPWPSGSGILLRNMNHHSTYSCLHDWLVVSTPLKNISPWEGLFHILWKKMCETTNQLGNGWVAGEWSNPENS